MQQMTREAFDRLNRLGDYIRERLTRMLRDRGRPAQVCGQGSLFLAHFTGEDLIDFRSLRGFSRTNPAYGGLCHQMLQHGIIVSPRGTFGCLSMPMTEAELDEFVDALDSSLTRLGV
jgi:glutamate-1-semialdehyde 2,1-aminomutase